MKLTRPLYFSAVATMSADSFAQMAHQGAQNQITLGVVPRRIFELKAVPVTVFAVKVSLLTLLFFVALTAAGAKIVPATSERTVSEARIFRLLIN